MYDLKALDLANEANAGKTLNQALEGKQPVLTGEYTLTNVEDTEKPTVKVAKDYTVTTTNEVKTVADDLAEELEIPDKADYDIKYWSETVDGDTAFDFTVAPTGDVTLYRVYKQTPVTTYTIKYYNEDGSELLDTKTINAGEKAEELEITAERLLDDYLPLADVIAETVLADIRNEEDD